MTHKTKMLVLFVAAFFLGLISTSTYKYLHQTFKPTFLLSSFKKTSSLLPDQAALEGERSFVFMMPTKTGKTVESILNQNYLHYRILYIKDHSVESVYRALHSCEDHEIVVFLGQEDYLADSSVLDKLNQYYQDPNIWLTHGHSINFPGYHSEKFVEELPRNIYNLKGFQKYLKEKHIPSVVGSCYAGLLKQISLRHLLHAGNPLAISSYDVLFLPILGKSLRHTYFVNEVLCVHHLQVPTAPNVHSSETHECTLSSYCPKVALNKRKPRNIALPDTDLIVFSFDRPLQLQAFLESAERYLKGIKETIVIYRASDADYAGAYAQVEEAFKEYKFIKQSDKPYEDFKPLVLKAVFESASSYVVFGVDDIIVKDDVDFKKCIGAMEKTGAYGFYLRLGENVDYCYALNLYQGIPTCISLEQGMRAWQFNQGEGEWKYPNSLDMTLFNKAEIKKAFCALNFKHPNSLEEEWAKGADYHKVGLCYEVSKIVNIPLNLVNPSANRCMTSVHTPQELLQKYKEGLKMDIEPLHRIRNPSAHMEYEPTFIKR